MQILFWLIAIVAIASASKSFKWYEGDMKYSNPISPAYNDPLNSSTNISNNQSNVTEHAGNETFKIVLKTGDVGDLGSSHCRCINRHYCPSENRIKQERAVNKPSCHDRDQVMCCQVPNPGCGVVEDFPLFRPIPTFGEANYGEFPWTALILDGREDVIYGTGVLISSNLVLTSARNIHHVTRGKSLRVRLGEWDLASDVEPFEPIEFSVQELVTHKLFNPKTFQNDIAVLRLNASVDFGSFPAIRSACLGRSGEDLKFINSVCYTAGWGSKSDSRVAAGNNFLKKVDLKMHDAPVCERAIRRGVENPDYHWDDLSFICAGGEEGKGLCRGDEGAALVCRDNTPGARYSLIGLSSWGTTCGQGGFPSVFTNIPTFYNWIKGIEDRV